MLFAACGGDPAATQADPIRFVDRLDDVEVHWGAGADEPPVKLKKARIGRAPDGGRLTRVMMSDTDRRSPTKRWFFDDRLALLAPTGTHYRFPVKLPAEPWLQLGLGSVGVAEGAPSEVRFEVKIDVDGAESVVILDEVVSVEAEGRWLDRELDLRRWAGRDVGVRFATHGAPEGPPVWAAWAAPEVVSGHGRQDGWDVVLISLDTLRADHLGCYGYARPTSPRIDALAARGFRFATAVSQSPWTKPSHRALFTGLYPRSRKGLASPYLASVLWRAGYRTLAMTGGGQVHPRFGFNAGFETYQVEDWVRSPGEVVERFARGRGRKQFLFLHTYEIHDPYFHTTFAEGLPSGWVDNHFSKRDRDPHRLGKHPSAVELAYVKALYDSGIAFVDDKLGRIFEELEDRGVFERAIVVLTSDHGEQFWEHGRWGHGTNVYDHQVLVPLIVYLPPALSREASGDSGPAPAVVAQQVRLIDVYPTLLDLLGLPLAHRVQGRSLRPLLAGGTMPEVDAFTEETNTGYEVKGLRSSRVKFVYSYLKREKDRTNRMELFDLLQDPGEQRNLVKERPELADALFRRMQGIIRGSRGAEHDPEVPDDDLDPKLREQLEALGYLGE